MQQSITSDIIQIDVTSIVLFFTTVPVPMSPDRICTSIQEKKNYVSAHIPAPRTVTPYSNFISIFQTRSEGNLYLNRVIHGSAKLVADKVPRLSNPILPLEYAPQIQSQLKQKTRVPENSTLRPQSHGDSGCCVLCTVVQQCTVPVCKVQGARCKGSLSYGHPESEAHNVSTKVTDPNSMGELEPTTIEDVEPGAGDTSPLIRQQNRQSVTDSEPPCSVWPRLRLHRLKQPSFLFAHIHPYSAIWVIRFHRTYYVAAWGPNLPRSISLLPIESRPVIFLHFSGVNSPPKPFCSLVYCRWAPHSLSLFLFPTKKTADGRLNVLVRSAIAGSCIGILFFFYPPTPPPAPFLSILLFTIVFWKFSLPIRSFRPQRCCFLGYYYPCSCIMPLRSAMMGT